MEVERNRKRQSKIAEMSDCSSGSDSEKESNLCTGAASNNSEKLENSEWWLEFIKEGKSIFDISKWGSPIKYTNDSILKLLPSFLRTQELAVFPSLVLGPKKVRRNDLSLFSKFCFHILKEIPFKEVKKRGPKGQGTSQEAIENQDNANKMKKLRDHIGKLLDELEVLLAGLLYLFADGVVKANHPKKAVSDFIQPTAFFALTDQFEKKYEALWKRFPNREYTSVAIPMVNCEPEYANAMHIDQQSASESDTEDELKKFKHKRAKIQNSKSKIDLHEQMIAAEKNTIRISRKEKQESQRKLKAKCANDQCVNNIRDPVGYSSCSSSDDAISDIGHAAFNLFSATSEEDVSMAFEAMRTAKRCFNIAKNHDPTVGTLKYENLIKMVQMSDNDSSDESDDESEEDFEDTVPVSELHKLMALAREKQATIDGFEKAKEKKDREREKITHNEKTKNAHQDKTRCLQLTNQVQKDVHKEPGKSTIESAEGVIYSQSIHAAGAGKNMEMDLSAKNNSLENGGRENY